MTADQQLICFGSNYDGECSVPEGLGRVHAVSAGYRHTCALREDGVLVCFGWNEAGQCDVPADLRPLVD